MNSKTYICEGYDPLFGPIRDLVRAFCIREANAKFRDLHGIHAIYTKLEK